MLPNKNKRPRAQDYEPSRYQWRFGRVPDTVRVGGAVRASPFREAAVFVVHGIGDQNDTDTAVSMRNGIERALDLIEPRLWDESAPDAWILPPPYVNDGYWAKYDDLETFRDDLADDLAVLTQRQRTFFDNAWSYRSKRWGASGFWLVRQGWKLVRKSHGTARRLFYLQLTGLVALLLFVAGIKKANRDFLVRFVNDARIYFEPEGDFEHEIVQLIDRRVANAFLRTIGVDWDLRRLPVGRQLSIDGGPKAFGNVVWVAHSLGTVISFNVIGDILKRCIDVRKEEAGRTGDYLGPCPRAERVERALSRFVTIGSPLDKILYLYDNGPGAEPPNSVLRRWPKEYLPYQQNEPQLPLELGGALGSGATTPDQPKPHFWTNFFYASDPISGPLDSIETFLNPDGAPADETLIENVSTRGWRVPVQSHVGYWGDAGVVAKILALLYSGYTKRVTYSRAGTQAPHGELFVRAWPPATHTWLSRLGLFSITALVAAMVLIVAWRYLDKIPAAVESAVGSMFGL